MLAATKVKMSGREKKEQEHVRYFLHKTRAKNVQKSVLHVQNCFLLIRTQLLLFFHRSHFLRRLALHDYLSCLRKL